jgi:hypothetical protein
VEKPGIAVEKVGPTQEIPRIINQLSSLYFFLACGKLERKYARNKFYPQVFHRQALRRSKFSTEAVGNLWISTRVFHRD